MHIRNKNIIDNNEEFYSNICNSVDHINVEEIQIVGNDHQIDIHNEDEDGEEQNTVCNHNISGRAYNVTND